MNNKNNKNVLITGGVSGMADALRASFHAAGYHLIVVDQYSDSDSMVLKRLADENFTYLQFDLSSTDSCDNLIPFIVEKYGFVDVLINNARSNLKKNFLDELSSDIHSVMNVNLISPMLLSQSLIKINANSNNNIYSSIINISSISSSFVGDESMSYHVSKAGLEMMTKYLAKYGGQYFCRANAISPGFILQDRYKKQYYSSSNKEYRTLVEAVHPLGLPGSCDDVANLALYLASDDARFINGHTIILDGGLTICDQWSLANKINKINNDRWLK